MRFTASSGEGGGMEEVGSVGKGEACRGKQDRKIILLPTSLAAQLNLPKGPPPPQPASSATFAGNFYIISSRKEEEEEEEKKSECKTCAAICRGN